MIISKATDIYLDDFKTILTKAKTEIENSDPKSVPSGELFEEHLLSILRKFSEKTIFHNTFEITSRLAFPDIISKIERNNWIGIEVKTSQKDWKCFGNSIFETTRVKEVENIFIFFLKSMPKLRCRWNYYANCIESINITHSPRYQINMDLMVEDKENIFDIFGITYDKFRALPIEDRMDYVRKLKKKEVGPDVALWWLPHNEYEEADDSRLAIKLFSEIETELKDTIICQAVIYFPELFLKKSSKKYQRVAKWLAAEYGVVSHSLRDMFSAGGKIRVKIDSNEFSIPRIFNILVSQRNKIHNLFNEIDIELLSEHWQPDLYNQYNALQRWIKLVSYYATTSHSVDNNFPIEHWLRELFIK